MNVRIDEQLLTDVTRKTGQAPEAILGEIEAIAQAHLKRLLGQPEEDVGFTLPIRHAGRDFEVKVTREPDHSAFNAIILDGDDAIITFGEDMDELLAMLHEAIELHYSDPSAA